MAVQHVVGHDAIRATVVAAVRDLDGDAARQLLARTIRTAGVDHTVTQEMVPALRQIGDAWASGEHSVMHEHSASNTFRGVLGHVSARSPGHARVVVLACPPSELHDLPLELFGALPRARGWRVMTLGANRLPAAPHATTILPGDMRPAAELVHALHPAPPLRPGARRHAAKEPRC